MSRWIRQGGALLLAALMVGCCSAECMTDKLPHRGVVRTTDELFELVQYSVGKECWEVVYDAMSTETRDKHSYLKIWVGLRHIEVPEPWGYKLVDVIAKGEFVDVWPNPTNAKQELVLVTYQEPDKPELLAQILVVEEKGADGKPVRRMALEEQAVDGPAFNQEPPPGE